MDIPRLTEEELKAVQDCWINKDEVSFLEVALQSPNLRPHFLALNSHRVIEIGPGKNPVTDHYSCREYFAANDRYPSDGLTVLKKENDASAVVVSFGIIVGTEAQKYMGKPDIPMVRSDPRFGGVYILHDRKLLSVSRPQL